MKKIIYILAGSTMFVSCKVGQNYDQPTVDLPAQFYAGNITTDTIANTVSKVGWQEFYKNKELVALIDLALERNTDLYLAVKNMEQTSLLFKQSKMALLPELTLNVAASHAKSSENSAIGLSGANRTNNDYTAAIGMSWELDVWGKIRRYKEAALATYLQNSEVTRAVKNRLIAEVANSYVNLLMLDEQLVIANEGIALRENTYLVTKKMFEVGNTTILAVQQAEAQWLESKELLPQLEQEIILQENILNVLLNKYPEKISRTISMKDLTFSTDFNTGVPADFLGSRPDIQIKEMGLKAANARVGAAQGEMYPALTISAQGGLNSIEASDWFATPASLFGTVAGGLIQPLFNQKKLRTNYEIAKLERDKAGIEFKNSVIVGFTEVQNALVKIEKIQHKEDVMRKRVEILNTSLANTKYMFEIDNASYLEVINAQSNALQGNLNFVELKRDYLASVIELYRALGGN